VAHIKRHDARSNNELRCLDELPVQSAGGE
jgi:hypothetical protein